MPKERCPFPVVERQRSGKIEIKRQNEKRKKQHETNQMNASINNGLFGLLGSTAIWESREERKEHDHRRKMKNKITVEIYSQ